MTVASPENLKPRKTPRRARAEATVDAILEACRVPFNLVSADLDTAERMDGLWKRIHDAATALLAGTADAEFDDLSVLTFTLLAAMSGAIRTVFERGVAPSMLRDLRTQLTTMSRRIWRR